ncbi:uncharacterized protein [Dermacentor andersoni]|uniref:uncharacterized protein n=1 Tax=Dermacentor andersoni TaxID=34620 RepID=UPI003B3BD3DB
MCSCSAPTEPVPSTSRGVLQQQAVAREPVPSTSRGVLQQQAVAREPVPSTSRGVLQQQAVAREPVPSTSRGVLQQQAVAREPVPSTSRGVLQQQAVAREPVPSTSRGVLQQQAVAREPVPSTSRGVLQQQAVARGPVPSTSRGVLQQQAVAREPVPSTSRGVLQQQAIAREPVPSMTEPSLTRLHDPVSTTPPLVVQEPAPSTSWSSSQELPSTPPGRGRSRIRKAITPRTKKRMQKYLEEIASLRRTVSRLRRASAIIPPARILAESSRYLNKDFLEILRVQMHLQPLKKHGRRWPKEFRQFALSLYFSSPKAYRYLAKTLSLPTVKTLRAWLSAVSLKPGLMPEILDFVKEKTKNWDLMDRACVLIFDEMSLKRNLQYDSRHDVVVGYTDTGTERSGRAASSALLFLVSGIAKQWLQPVAFMIGDGSVPSEPILNFAETTNK